MRLPNVEQAVVAPRKVVEYLLSRTNPRSQNKAAYFEALGYSPDNWGVLADALLAHANSHEIADRDDTPFGTWYTIEGEFEAPRGNRPRIRTVWFVDIGNRIPRFVTAYPLPRSAS